MGSFYQLIRTDQQQGDAIKDLYRKNQWILHAKVLSEHVVKGLLQNEDAEIVSFIQSTSMIPSYPIMPQEDKGLNNQLTDYVSATENLDDFVVEKNELYRDHVRLKGDSAAPLSVQNEPELEAVYDNDTEETGTCSDTEPEMGISVNRQQKKLDQSTADVYNSSFYTDLEKKPPLVPTTQPNYSAQVQPLYDQYVQVTNMFHSTISQMNQDEQQGTESPFMSSVNTVKSLVETLHTAEEAINKSCPSQPSPKIKKKQRLVAKKRPQSNRSRSVRSKSANRAKKKTAEMVVNKKDLHEKKATRKRTSYVGQYAVAPGVKAEFPCTYCESVYAERRALRRHVLFKHPERPAPPPLRDCYVCKKEFSTKKELIQHRTTEHHNPTRKKTFQCKQCGDILSRPETLKQHDMIPHTEKDRFECDICGKVFNKAVKANTHKRNVHEVINSSCEICGKTFDKLLSLLKHRPRHNLENKKHMCEHCGKSFFSSCAMNLHARTHTGEKPFKCRFCDYASSWRANTQKHEKIHAKNTEDQMETYIAEQFVGAAQNYA